MKDYGDISYKAKNVDGINNMSHLGDVAGCTNCLSEQIQQILKEDRRVLTIGGDHSVGIGTIDGHVKVQYKNSFIYTKLYIYIFFLYCTYYIILLKEKKNVGVLWIDAHADLNTNKTSESGNVHGMPVALLTSELADYWPHLPGMDWQQPM